MMKLDFPGNRLMYRADAIFTSKGQARSDRAQKKSNVLFERNKKPDVAENHVRQSSNQPPLRVQRRDVN